MKKSRLSDNELKQLLAGQQRIPPMADADEFWARFRARAELVPQAEPSPAAHGLGTALWPRWALAGVTVAALILLMLTIELPLRRSSGRQALQALSKVDQVDVFVDYASMMIVEDSENGGTLVWLAGIDAEAPNGDG
jgi:hypothetical protein